MRRPAPAASAGRLGVLVAVLCLATGVGGRALPGRVAFRAAGRRGAGAPSGRGGVGGQVTFLAVGDWGMVSRRQAAVADAMAKAAGDLSARFIVSTGDNFYECGVVGTDDPQWRDTWQVGDASRRLARGHALTPRARRLQDMFSHPSLRLPWLSVLGNHDHFGDADAQVAFSRSGRDRRWVMPDRNFTRMVRVDAHTKLKVRAA